MQVLELKLKLVIQWIINKKNQIHALVVNHLPIYRGIKQFVESYIKFMNQIVTIAQKVMSDLSKNTNDQASSTLLDLFDLIRQKEIINIEEWKQKLATILNKQENKAAASHKPFPDIFRDIDVNIEYYSQLRSKLNQAISKKNHSHLLSQPQIRAKTHLSRESDTQRLGDHGRRKTQVYATLYDKQYEGLKYSNQTTHKGERHVGRIRNNNNYNSVNSAELSPYRLVNPRFSPTKQQNSYYFTNPEIIDRTKTARHLDSQQNGRFTTLGNQKYVQYKTDLYSNMKKATQQYPIVKQKCQIKSTPIKQSNKVQKMEYSTANSNKSWKHNPYSTGKKIQTTNKKSEQQRNQKTGNLTGRKYQYLFDEDRQFQGASLQNNYPQNSITRQLPSNQTQRLYQYHNPTKQYRFNNYKQLASNPQSNSDSLQLHDRLGTQLQVDMPTIFKQKQARIKQSNLQQLLADSLMSSKKWDSNGEQQYEEPSEGDEDSLDERQIIETGKFKIIDYEDEDQQLFPQRMEVKRRIVKNSPKNYLQKQTSTQSKQLNMSFGRN